MKTLNDVREYAMEKGYVEGHRLDMLLDLTETDENGNMSEEYFQDVCFGIDCETEEN